MKRVLFTSSSLQLLWKEPRAARSCVLGVWTLRRVRQETPRDPAGLCAAGGGFGLGFSEEKLPRRAGLPAVRSDHGWDISHSLVVLSARGRPAACLPGEHSSRPFPEGTGQRAVLPGASGGEAEPLQHLSFGPACPLHAHPWALPWMVTGAQQPWGRHSRLSLLGGSGTEAVPGLHLPESLTWG